MEKNYKMQNCSFANGANIPVYRMIIRFYAYLTSTLGCKGEWLLPADCFYVSHISLLFLLRDDPSLKKINGEKESRAGVPE